MDYIITNWADLLQIALAVLGVASLIAKLTPTEADNKVIEKIFKVVHTFGLTKKK